MFASRPFTGQKQRRRAGGRRAGSAGSRRVHPESYQAAAPSLSVPCFVIDTGTNGSKLARSALQRRGWLEVSELWQGTFDYAWLAPSHGMRGVGSTDWPGRHGSFVVNRWPGGCPSLFRKDLLAKSLEAFYLERGLDPWEFLPRTFSLPVGANTQSAEWQAFAAAHARAEAADGARLWLMKPVARSLGGGIGVHWSLAGLQQHWRWEHGESNLKQRVEAWLAQQYVDTPLLWRGRKWCARAVLAHLQDARAAPTGLAMHARGG
jgi:hypothetical protein